MRGCLVYDSMKSLHETDGPINGIINKMTNSADKQLGYFFAKADDADIIKYDRFVAKVCFYL